MTRKTTPITTTTKKVTTTTVTTVETVEVRTIYLDFSCSFDGTNIIVASMNYIVTRTEDRFEVLVGEDDTTVLRLAEPKLNGVAATFRVRSRTTEFDSQDWTHNTAGFESPAFPLAAEVTIDITATLSRATGGDANVAGGDDFAAGDGTEKGTTLIVVIKKPGLGERDLAEG
jgi:hypothetical protein